MVRRRSFGEQSSYRREVGARIPKPNPDYNVEAYGDAKEYAKRIQWGRFAGSRELEEDEK